MSAGGLAAHFPGFSKRLPPIIHDPPATTPYAPTIAALNDSGRVHRTKEVGLRVRPSLFAVRSQAPTANSDGVSSMIRDPGSLFIRRLHLGNSALEIPRRSRASA